MRELLQTFGADLVHITGPSDVGMLGALVAHDLKLPLVASWHTNIHEFGARRLGELLSFLPTSARGQIAHFTEQQIILALSLEYYRLGRVLLAPNPELVDLLHRRTGRPTFLMQRGVDTEFFSPEKRTRCDGQLTIGYVGRLSPEKSVRASARRGAGFAVGGHRAIFASLLSAMAMSRNGSAPICSTPISPACCAERRWPQAYANMDIFAFPSHTDTFGNVVLEALASGVPAVVTARRRAEISGNAWRHGSGFGGYASRSSTMCWRWPAIRAKLHRMRVRARDFALCRYWHRIFEQVYDAYEYCLRARRRVPAAVPRRQRNPSRPGLEDGKRMTVRES